MTMDRSRNTGHPGLSDPQVLVVDDSGAERRALHSLIEAEGYTVVSRGSGREALNLLEDTSVALIVTKLMMRDIDGLELLDTVKKEYPDIHVVVNMGSISENGKAMLKSRRAVGYLVKPIKKRSMQILLRALLSSDNLGRPSEVVAVSADPTVLKMFDDDLADRGIFVKTYNSVRKALAEIWNNPPDLVLCQIQVGREDGFELVRQVRSAKKMPFIPIVLVTTDATQEHIIQAIQLRVNGVLSMPLAEDTLCDKVLELLRKSRA